MKKKIYCLVGRTGSGKDTIADAVTKQTGIRKVVSFTDAPKRSDQTEGKEHYFLSKGAMDSVLSEQHAIAYTQIGNNRYCATLEEIGTEPVLYIIDPKGIYYMKEHFADQIDLTVFYIFAPEKTRRERTKNRGNFDFEERMNAENEEFTEFCKNNKTIFIMNNGALDIPVNRICKEIKA